jgi:hypothetical protein
VKDETELFHVTNNRGRFWWLQTIGRFHMKNMLIVPQYCLELIDHGQGYMASQTTAGLGILQPPSWPGLEAKITEYFKVLWNCQELEQTIMVET